MAIITNAEFKSLVGLSDRTSPRLRMVARKRHEGDPNGVLSERDLASLTSIFQGSPDGCWLQSLSYMKKSGKLDNLESGKVKWEAHVAEVAKLYRKGEVAFKLGDHVFFKESGKYGMILDYFPEENKYLVSFDPFHIEFCDKKDLEKTASKCV